MSGMVTLLTLVAVLGSAGAASGACASVISEFETIINSDAETGNLNKGVHRRIIAELGPVKASCAAGRDADSSRSLATIKSRHGYR